MKETLSNYLPLLLLLLAFFGYRFYQKAKIQKELPQLMSRGGTIVDVRTKEEFQRGHHPKSINIPLSELPRRLKELKKTDPIILVCASGMRSGQALSILKREGFTEAINGGAWSNTMQ